MRTCIGCRRALLADRLVRVRRDGDRLVTDPGAAGRGAWVCPDGRCFDLATRRRAWSRAFRSAVSEESIEGLRSQGSWGRVAVTPGVREKMKAIGSPRRDDRITTTEN